MDTINNPDMKKSINSLDSDKIDILLAEYSACNEGYNNRDTIVFWEFSILIGIFSGLLTVMTYILSNLEQPFLQSIAITIIGILGFLSILGISIVMQSAHSCKVAIRDRMKAIEKEISRNSNQLMKLWSSVVEEREKKSGLNLAREKKKK